MQHRKSASVSGAAYLYGRPSGTDGSDFSYRMVVESRYKKVAEGKKQLVTFIIAQVLIQLIGASSIAATKFLHLGEPSRLYISSVALGSFALMMGELGRRRSRASFLKVYMVASPIAFILSAIVVAKSSLILKVIQDPSHPSNWKGEGFETYETLRLLSWFLIEIFAGTRVISLLDNMRPPKRTSGRPPKSS